MNNVNTCNNKEILLPSKAGVKQLIIIRLSYTYVWKSMGKPCSCIQFIKSRIFTASHARIHISTKGTTVIFQSSNLIGSIRV